MKAIKHLLACTLLATAVPSFAGPVTLDFENAPSSGFLVVGDLYKDATGISFSSSANLVGSKAFYGEDARGSFVGQNGSHGAITGLNGTNDTPVTFTITIAAGFTGLFSMSFTGFDSSVYITAYGNNGAAIGDANAHTASLDACGDTSLACQWTDLSIDLSGKLAKQVTIEGISSQFFIDYMSFRDVIGINDTGGTTPEPTGIALSMAALGALAWTRKRAKAGSKR